MTVGELIGVLATIPSDLECIDGNDVPIVVHVIEGYACFWGEYEDDGEVSPDAD